MTPRQHGASLGPTVVQGWGNGQDPGRPGGGWGGTRQRELAAGRRWNHSQDALRGKTNRNPADGGKPGTNRTAIVEENRYPMRVGADGTNVHNSKLLQATIQAILVEQPQPTPTKCNTSA